MKRLVVVFVAAMLMAIPAAASGKTTSTTWKNIGPPSTTVWYRPLLTLSIANFLRAECVMGRESRSTLDHPNIGDDNGNPGQSGIFQMNNQPGGIWDTYVLPKLHVLIWKASAFQQAEGFIIVWHVDGFGPWHPYDNC